MVSRKALLLGWLGITGLTFFSALVFKSGAIETDVRERAMANLESNNIGVPELSVHGRHVTLAGFVPSEAHKEASLEIANDTYGALGPRDRLNVFSASGGYFSAIKSDAGVTLAGVVPSEEARSALVEMASAGDLAVDRRTSGRDRDQIGTCGDTKQRSCDVDGPDCRS